MTTPSHPGQGRLGLLLTGGKGHPLEKKALWAEGQTPTESLTSASTSPICKLPTPALLTIGEPSLAHRTPPSSPGLKLELGGQGHCLQGFPPLTGLGLW